MDTFMCVVYEIVHDVIFILRFFRKGLLSLSVLETI